MTIGLDERDLAIASIDQRDGRTTIEWESGHVSVFPDRLIESLQRRTERRRWTPSLWQSGHVVGEVDHDDLLGDERVRREALLAYRQDGVLVVRGIPSDGRATEGFLDELRVPIWDGPFGRVIDTQIQTHAYNVAETAEALPPHTDLAGYVWPPSGQILHMLVNECAGGDSLVVDGWHVLEGLRSDHPDAFELLVTVEVAHRLFSDDRETFARAPLVRLDASGAIAGIRYSNQTLEPLSLDEPQLTGWLDAYAELTRRLHDPANATTFRLESTDAYLTHAHRVLHARTAFEATGNRIIRDVYFEFDNVLALLDQLTGEVPA